MWFCVVYVCLSVTGCEEKNRLIGSWPKCILPRAFVFVRLGGFFCLFCFCTISRTLFHSRLCKTDTKVILEKNTHNTITAVIEQACLHITCSSFCKIRSVYFYCLSSMMSEPLYLLVFPMDLNKIHWFHWFVYNYNLSSPDWFGHYRKNTQLMSFNRLNTHRNGPVHWNYLK